MADRKTINKYYPPDFDPSKISVSKGPKSTTLQTVRLMSPFSMRCTTCGEYIYKGKKFNARKQPTSDLYLDKIRIIRFLIKCPRCAGEIAFKTDPMNASYLVEWGAERNLGSYRTDVSEEKKLEMESVEERLIRLEREELEATAKKDKDGNPIIDDPDKDVFKELEEKVDQAKREQELNDELMALRARNSRQNEIIIPTPGTSVSKEEEEDLDIAKQIFAEKRRITTKEKNAQESITGTSQKVLNPLIPTASRISKKKKNRLGVVRRVV